MDKLIRISVRNQTLTFFTALIIITAGIITFLGLPQNEDPQIKVRAVQIVTIWQGATPEDVELYITKPLEEAVAKQDSVDKISSSSMAGLSVITVVISEYVTKEDVKTAYQQIRNYVNDSRGDLPDEIYGPIINNRFGETTAYVLGLVSESGKRTYR